MTNREIFHVDNTIRIRTPRIYASEVGRILLLAFVVVSAPATPKPARSTSPWSPAATAFGNPMIERPIHTVQSP